MSTSAKIRTGAAAAVALACCVAAAIAVASGVLGGQFQSIGNRDAPAVDSTTCSYFSLNDMDAQVANVLLVGGDTALGADRSQDLAIYDSDRSTADADLTQALATEDGNAAAQRELRSVLDGVGQYEALAADALLTDQQTRSSVGRAPAASLGYYQQATDLMQTSILPSVSSLTDVSASRLDASYTDGTSTARTMVGVVIAAGVALIAILVALQLYLSARFRRLVSPALAAATADRGRPRDHGRDSVLRRGGSPEGGQAGRLRFHPRPHPGACGELRRQRGREQVPGRPRRAAQYQQAFLTKSQQLADVGNVAIFGYDAALATDVRAYDGDNSDVRFGGYLGAEFRNITFPGERAAAVLDAACLPGLRNRRQETARDGENEPGGSRRV